MQRYLHKTRIYFAALVIIVFVASLGIYSAVKTSDASQHQAPTSLGLLIVAHHLASPSPGVQQKAAQTTIAKKTTVNTTIDDEVRQLMRDARNAKKRQRRA